ncbi:MAG: hypothetical protein ACOCRX_00600 [Candidatus Woesearchaeota archaeon]
MLSLLQGKRKVLGSESQRLGRRVDWFTKVFTQEEITVLLYNHEKRATLVQECSSVKIQDGYLLAQGMLNIKEPLNTFEINKYYYLEKSLYVVRSKFKDFAIAFGLSIQELKKVHWSKLNYTVLTAEKLSAKSSLTCRFKLRVAELLSKMFKDV